MVNKTSIKGVNTGNGTPPSCDSETAHVTISQPNTSNISAYIMGDFNLKPYYDSLGEEYSIKYNGGFWYLMGGHGSQELAFANPGNENYPWEATWPAGYSVTKLCP